MLDVNNVLIKIYVLIFILCAFLFILLQGAHVLWAAGYSPAPGWFEVKTIYLDLKDSSWNREVPVKICYPSFEDKKQAAFGILAFH